MGKIIKGFLGIFIFMSSLNICYARDTHNKYINENISVVNKMYNYVNIQNNNYNSNGKSYGKISTMKELIPILRKAMENRETDISIKYGGSEGINNIQGIIEEVINSDPYLKYSWKGYNVGMSGYSGDLTIKLGLRYLTTKAEEDYVDKKVNEILSKIIRDDMNDYAKEKAIHDYIVSHVQYDRSLVEHSAYAALTKGHTVCQGYSLLMCKMLQKVGIKNIIVSSEAMNHAWNMVCIDNKWYHVDVTWDDPVPDVPNRILYNYYNLTDNEIKDSREGKGHIWDEDKYPRAFTHYNPKDVEQKSVNMKLDVTNNITFNIKLNENISMKKVELFDGDKFLKLTTNIKNRLAFMDYSGSLQSKLYKLKITVDDGRSCFTDIKIQPTLEVLEVDNKHKVVKIKSLIDGQLSIDKSSFKKVNKGQIITVNKNQSVCITPYTIQEGVAYNSVKLGA